MPSDEIPGESSVPPPAPPTDIGGQITPDTFLGVRTSGPFAGMLLANNPDDPGLADAVEQGHIVSAIMNAPPGTEVPPPPVLSSLSPDTAEVGNPQITVTIYGSGFTEQSRVIWNGSNESSGAFVSDTEMTVGVDPGTATGPWAVPVWVDNGFGSPSNALDFQFTETVPVDPPPPEEPPEDTVPGGEDTIEGGS